MAQWQELLRLDSALQGQVSRLYERKFPREIRHCLSVWIESQDCCSRPTMEQTWTELYKNVEELRRQTSDVKKEIKALEALNENLDHIQKTWQSEVEQHVGLAESRAFVEDECLKRANFIIRTKQMVLQQILNILNLAKQVVETLTAVELPEWKHRQQMSCIGSPADTSLDHLQKWFTTVAEVLQQIHQELQKLQDQSKKYNITDDSNLPGLPDIEKFTLSLYKELLTKALVVEKQPIMSSLPNRPLILKTRVRFAVTVRFLANLPEFKCRLQVKPVFDKFRCFDFTVDNSKVLDVDAPEGGLVAEFGHMNEGAWIWIDGILDLIKRHLVDFWKDGSIMGFVSREKTKSLLKEKPAGTFLLRFSESIIDGAITFSWVDHSNGEAYVHSVEPYTKKEMLVDTLPYIIYNYSLKVKGNKTRNPLLYLYPDIDKDTAFRRYYSSSSMTTFEEINGYVRKIRGHQSDDPTPPPSPPQEPLSMDTDTDVDMETETDARVKTAIAHMKDHQLIEELFPDLLDTSRSPFYRTSEEETLIKSGQFCFPPGNVPAPFCQDETFY
eukprot:superscaffoldBa00003720_g17556